MITWIIKPFQELSLEELYHILQLRENVFVVEQNCVFQDIDEIDFGSYHVMGTLDQTLVAYSRIIPPGVAFDSASIGRVSTKKEARMLGYGKMLMLKSIEYARSLGYKELTIGAQYYLLKFYQEFGFKDFGEIYILDGIKHIHMKLKNEKA